eukprot:1143607-Pelagomonas_calceolata.AAC.7
MYCGISALKTCRLALFGSKLDEEGDQYARQEVSVTCTYVWSAKYVEASMQPTNPSSQAGGNVRCVIACLS